MRSKPELSFVDVFAGCGGLSLGLMQAGWKGLFAIEADLLAFETLKENLLNNGDYSYDWPSWLPQEPRNIKGFLADYKNELKTLIGKVGLLVGGPPCQGFSLAGRRKKDDPRNQLFKYYLEIVELIRPQLLFFENVRGVTIEFGKKHMPLRRGPGRPAMSFSSKIQNRLTMMGYKVFPKLVRAIDYGVPQLRPRFIMVAIDQQFLSRHKEYDPFTHLDDLRKKFLVDRGLPQDRPVTAQEAISDLEIRGKQIVDCPDVKGYQQIAYGEPATVYQKLLHGNLNGTSPNSLRLAKHSIEIQNRFQYILDSCRRGVQLNETDRLRLGLKKKCLVPMSPDQPCHTLTSLPDDMIHYSEARILSVREYARLQSFPDWYAFKGKYTTGGDRRVKECPRYTQVANAVPPFLAEVMGLVLKKVRESILT